MRLWMCGCECGVRAQTAECWSPLHYSNVRYWLSCCSRMRLTCDGACGRWHRCDSLFAYHFVHLTPSSAIMTASRFRRTPTNSHILTDRSREKSWREKNGSHTYFYFLFVRIGSFYGFCSLLSSTSYFFVSRIFGHCFVSKLCTHTSSSF